MLNALSDKIAQLAIVLHLLSVAIAAPAVYQVSPQNAPIPTIKGIEGVAGGSFIAGKFLPKKAVLVAVSRCESGSKQFNDDGSVVTHKNKNGTTDYGEFQINSIHLPESEKLGLDIINSKEDNVIFADYLYDKYGTKIWYGFNSKTGKCAWEF